MRHQNASKTVV